MPKLFTGVHPVLNVEVLVESSEYVSVLYRWPFNPRHYGVTTLRKIGLVVVSTRVLNRFGELVEEID